MPAYIEVTLIIEPEDGQYAARCVELGTASCGDTVEEAAGNLHEAIELQLETLAELGDLDRFLCNR